jgi:8-oxo-dGTP pyrophosphatase MutT (NUDIX family)
VSECGEATTTEAGGRRERQSRGKDLPVWWDPLLSRVELSEAADFTRLPTPESAGRASAVLVLLGEEGPDSGPDVLMLQRADTLRNHAGQPAFPGGACDPGDVDVAATALREAAEEVGLDPTSVEVVADLPTLWIPVSDFLVTPVLGWWRSPHPVRPIDPAEVARVERLPVSELVDPANRLRVRHPSGWIGPAFRVRGMLVWGFTAGVLSTLLEMGGWSVPWRMDRVEGLPGSGSAPVR